MPHEKIKKEDYSSLGGIANKISQYTNGPHEFLDLKNVDFQTPNDLTQRWGSTAYVGQTLPGGKITGLFEYTKVQGESYIVTTGSTQAFSVTGTSLTSFWSTAVHLSNGPFNSAINATLYGFTAPWSYVLGASLNYDFQVMNNTLYACNGKDFWKWTGSSAYFFGLPVIPSVAVGFIQIVNSAKRVASTGLTAGIYDLVFSYYGLNSTVGPAAAQVSNSFNIGVSEVIDVSLDTAMFSAANPGFGISGIVAFIKKVPEQTTYTLVGNTLGTSVLVLTPSSATFTINSMEQFGVTEMVPYLPWGVWYNTGSLAGENTITLQTTGDQQVNPANFFPSYVPKFMENYSNRLWISGTSALPSNIFFSEFLEPELFDPENFIDIRTDDGAAVTALKAFNSRLYIFKQTSFHELSGDDPENFSVRQISREYGCISNRGTCEYQDQMLFLDRKGIVQFNGANINLISVKVDPVFKRMNLDAAPDNSSLTYDKLRNQVICDIPVDGSAVANLSVVWDIVSDAWTTYDYPNYKPAVTTIAKGRLDNFYTLIGSYSGLIANFGASFTTDNGTGYTCVIKSRYHHEMGQSTTKQFRRLFLNFDPVGATIPIKVDFHLDYGTSTVLGLTTFESPFQSRLEFGLPGKSLAFDLYRFSLTDKFVFHGYTIGYRYQRDV